MSLSTTFPTDFQHRLDLLNWRRIKNIVAMCLIAGTAFSAGNWFRSLKDQEATLPAIQKAAKELPKAAAIAGCEQWRSHTIEKKIDQQGAVAKEDVPKDNCPHIDPKQ